MSITAGQRLVALLEKYGVEYVFGIPGTHSIELYRGLADSTIQHISPRHEQGGGFMADGYARVSGKPGVCFVITGPGVTNLTTPMGEAYMDSVPMLVISPVNEPDPDQVNRGRLHEITSQQAVTAPLTAFSETVSDAAQIPELVARAFDLFASERPRPVHINIPLSVIRQAVDKPWQPRGCQSMVTASEENIERIASALKGASSPILVVGGGACRGSAEIIALAEKIPCPVITTVAARGVVNADHELGVGAQLRATYVQELLGSSDMGIFLGTEFAQTDHWNDRIRLPEVQAWVNICPHALENRDAQILVHGDCVDLAKRLADRLPAPEESVVDSTRAKCAQWRSLHKRDFTPKEFMHWQALEIIRQRVSPETTVVSDMTQLAYTAVGYQPLQLPGQWLHPTGYGTLGYALPAGIGAILGNHSRSALVVVGDAGLQYTQQEMNLAAELELNLVVLLWNNDALQQICDDMDDAAITRIGVTQQNPDFIAMAKACHWQARQLDGLHQLGDALADGFEQKGPVLIKLDEASIQPG